MRAHLPLLSRALMALLLLTLCACTTLEEKRDQFLSRGQAAYEKKDFIAARLHVKNALQIDPKHAPAYLWLAKTEMQLNNPREAFAAVSRAVELDPGLIEAQLLLGNLLLAGRRLEDAEARAKLVLDREPDNPEARMLQAGVAVARRQPEEALRLLADLRRQKPDKVEAWLLSSAILTQEKRPQEAARLLDEAISANPQALPLYFTRARLANELKDPETARRLLNRARDLAPQNPQVLEELSRFHLSRQEWDQAEAALRAKKDLEPDNPGHVTALAHFLADRGRAAEGEKLLTDFAAARPKNLAAKQALAHFHLRQRRLGQAERLLQEIAAADPTGPEGLKAKGELAALLLTQGRREETQALVKEVLKANPRDTNALKVGGLLALQTNDGLTAVGNFRLLTQDQPQNPEHWLLLARAHQLQKEDTLAREAAKKALALRPDYGEAKAFLYGTYLEKKDYDGLISLLQEHLRAREHDLTALAYLGDAHAAKGRPAEAQAAFRKMIALEPKNPQGYLKLALFLRQQGQAQAALPHLERALQENPRAYPALRLLAAFLSEQGQASRAVERVRAALAADPDNDELHQILGEVLLSRKEYEAAAQALERALTLNPRDPQPLGLLARAHEGLLSDAAARERLLKAAADPQAPVFRPLALAQAYERLGDLAAALPLYEGLLARELPPGLAAVVKNNLAYLLAEARPEAGTLSRAEKLAREVLEDNPGDPRVLDTLGWVLCRRGDYAQARPYLERAAALSPRHPVLQFHRGYCLAKLGEKEPAREALRQALAAPGDFPQRPEAEKLLKELEGRS